MLKILEIRRIPFAWNKRFRALGNTKKNAMLGIQKPHVKKK
jgi:hypothetical protein